MVLGNNLIATKKLKEDYVTDNNENHNIESESQRGVVIHKLYRKLKWLNRALFNPSAKHVTRKKELNNKLEKPICDVNATWL